ncbi:FAD-dependent monooxygenase [Marinomonas ostreistagni]|nr:FAD-dependent monooxygenase [Marinomonas ostreistagni]
MCGDCQGRGKRPVKIRKKTRLAYQQALAAFERGELGIDAPEPPQPHLESCPVCAGSGLVESLTPMAMDPERLPHVAIIGAGIGGMALAVACRHRGIPFTLYERDLSFDARSQGYGLTLQQASRAISGIGITELKDGVISTRHVVHTIAGEKVAEWGMRRWVKGAPQANKKSNIHIARQSLRYQMMEQLGGASEVQWGHQLVSFDQTSSDKVQLTLSVDGELKHAQADLIVGADGIRSMVRQNIIGEQLTPLRSLNCMVILGICPLSLLGDLESDLLDGATVFQTANGNERIYMMPYKADSVMWQLSFRMDDAEARALSALGAQALKDEAVRRLPWHAPIPEILAATPSELVSGYPVYDRELLTPEQFAQSPKATLIGDGAHPMTPFKGQGANQAILDALSLAREISQGCWSAEAWQSIGIRAAVLSPYEQEMLARSSVKVEGSAAAAEFLHSDVVLEPVDQPRRA